MNNAATTETFDSILEDLSNVETDEGAISCYMALQKLAQEEISKIKATQRCSDCGEHGERKGHQTCQYPRN